MALELDEEEIKEFNRDMAELLGKAIQMRKAQKEYFKNRDKKVLEISKKLEREFDSLAQELCPEFYEAENQGNLF